jgi:putative transposase
MVLKNIKSFTALKLIDCVMNNKQESRRTLMMEVFERNGAKNKSTQKFQFWQHENHPILLDNARMYDQRMNYLHENPVRAGFVYEPQDWVYSSAVDYYTANEKGLIEIISLE